MGCTVPRCEPCRRFDVAKAKIPTRHLRPLHSARVRQYKKGKHAVAWTAMKAMPTMHWQPSILTDGMKGGGCHKIRIEPRRNQELKNNPGYGTASCDACHTRHTFGRRSPPAAGV